MSVTTLDILLAGLNVDRVVRDAIAGDLLEERAALAARQGERRADRWMRRQIVLSMLAFGQAALRDGGVRRLAAIVGAAVTAMLAVGVLIAASSAIWFAVLTPEALARLAVVALAIDLAFGAAGGYLAARLGRSAPLGAALVFGVLGLVLTLTAGAAGWYALALQLLLVPATLSGGWLRARHLARHRLAA